MTTMDSVLAKPADLCCIKGAIHSGEETGAIEQIDGIDTYVARPPAGKANGNVILLFPDALGLHINTFLMADAYAECGYLTLVVDYFKGVCFICGIRGRTCVCHGGAETLKITILLL